VEGETVVKQVRGVRPPGHRDWQPSEKKTPSKKGKSLLNKREKRIGGPIARFPLEGFEFGTKKRDKLGEKSSERGGQALID